MDSSTILNELNTEDIDSFCSKFLVPIRLCGVMQSGYPLVCSLWYEYSNNEFLCATQKSASIARLLTDNPKCAFELSPNEPPYFGIRGTADADITTVGAAELLTRLIERYTGDLDSRLARMLLKNADNEVMLKIKPKSIYSWDYRERMTNQ